MHLWKEIVRRTRTKDRNMTPPPWVMKMGHLVKYRGRGIEKVGWSEKWDGFSDCNPSLLHPQRPGQINWLDPNQHHLIWTRHTGGLINYINRLWKGEWTRWQLHHPVLASKKICVFVSEISAHQNEQVDSRDKQLEDNVGVTVWRLTPTFSTHIKPITTSTYNYCNKNLSSFYYCYYHITFDLNALWMSKINATI